MFNNKKSFIPKSLLISTGALAFQNESMYRTQNFSGRARNFILSQLNYSKIFSNRNYS